MQPQVTRDVIQGSALRQAQIRPRSGIVRSVNSTNHTMTLDVGHIDTNGNAGYLIGIAYLPTSPPQIGDVIALNYSDLTPYQPTVGGSAIGGQNSTGTITTSGVNSLKADSGAKITGDVQLVSGTGITLSEAGQAITVSGCIYTRYFRR